MLLSPADLDDRFYATAQNVGAIVTSYVQEGEKGPLGETLAIHVASLGAEDAKKRIVVTAGLHGLERPLGSLLETEWMSAARIISERTRDIAFTFVDNLNPAGSAHGMRGDLKNCDLNRNFIDFEHLPNPSSDYRELADAFSPRSLTRRAYIDAWRKLATFAVLRGSHRLRQALLGGQWEFPDGLYYTGKEASWTNRQWRDVIIPNHIAHRELHSLHHIDIHTGEGPWAFCQVMINQADDTALRERVDALHVSDMVRLTEETFAHVKGDIIDSWSSTRLEPHVKVTPLTLEIGTSRMSSWLEGSDVLYNLMLRNTLRQKFGDDHRAAGAIVHAAREIFFPTDHAWQNAARSQAHRFFERLLEAVSGTPVAVIGS